MKKILTMLVVLTVMCSSASANEIDAPKTPVGMAVVKAGSIFKLFYKGGQSGDVKVTILDSKGNSVFKETIRNIESFVRPYNFSSLSEGEYTIELDGSEGKQLQKIRYQKATNNKLANLLHVTGSDNRYMLTVSNKTGLSALNIKIFDKSNSLVYSSTENIEGDYAKIFNLDKIGDDFTFEVTAGNSDVQILTNDR